jgi:hypothetical protein
MLSQNLLWGASAVLGMVITWVAQVELIQRLSSDFGYSKPLLSSILGQSYMALCFVFAAAYMQTANNKLRKQGLKSSSLLSFERDIVPLVKEFALPSFLFTLGYQTMGYIWYALGCAPRPSLTLILYSLVGSLASP